MKVRLSWPAPALFPNVGAHWAVLKDLRGKAKHEAFYAARAAGFHPVPDPNADIPVKLTFHPWRRNHPADDDNLVAAMKGGIDGIALALGVDDRRFRLSIERGEPVKRGAVIVEVG